MIVAVIMMMSATKRKSYMTLKMKRRSNGGRLPGRVRREGAERVARGADVMKMIDDAKLRRERINMQMTLDDRFGLNDTSYDR
jgi:hypothetical protein